MERITSKAQMYAMLAAGRLGNTIRQFFSVDEWRASRDAELYPQWGVRTLIAGGPCRLFCPREEVADTVAKFGCAVNISMMIDAICRVTLWADIFESESGLVVHGIEYPPVGGSWRALMPTAAREWRGLAARMLLRRHLNANSLDDLDATFERWPGHVVELSACERCIGVIPGRNAVVWEVRSY